MTVLLIRPPRRGGISFLSAMECEPLELEYLAAACAQRGLSWGIWDGVTETRPLRAVLETCRPKMVAISGYLPQEEEIRLCAALAREVCPGCVTVVGGVHAQRNPERLFWSEVDVVFRGESAEDFAALAAGAPPETLDGICVRKDGEWVQTPYVPGEISRLPLPDRTLWERDRKRFRYMDLTGLSTMKTAYSCPFSCSFCYGSGLHGGAYQALTVERVLEDLENVPGKNIFITDYDFLLDETRLNALLDGMDARGIHKTFVCYARADFIVAHPALMKRLAEHGFLWYAVGIESVSDGRLTAWNKGTTTDLNRRCIKALRDLGCTCVGLTIVDLNFTKQDFRALYQWAKESGLRYVSAQVLTPIPGTAFYEQNREKMAGIQAKRFDLAHALLEPEHMTRGAFMRRYSLLMARLLWLGWRRGAYRFVTVSYLFSCVSRWIREKKLLK